MSPFSGKADRGFAVVADLQRRLREDLHGLAALQADRGALGNERRKKIRWRGREITEDNASASC